MNQGQDMIAKPGSIYRSRYYLALILMAFSGQAHGATDDGNTKSDQLQCELHIWPTDSLHAHFGINAGGIVGGLISKSGELHHKPETSELFYTWLDVPTQLSVVNSLDLRKLLKDDNYTVVIEPPMPAEMERMGVLENDLKQNVPNLACRSEFRIVHLTYSKDGWNHSLISYLIFREIKNGVETKFAKKFLELTLLKSFPPKDEAGYDLAQIDLKRAFAYNIEMFIEKEVFKKQ